jgi:tetratricopeptide (TPR) repeat protein
VLATAIIAIAAFNVGERSPADVLTALVGPSLDSTVYAVLPFRRDESGLTTIGESEILYDAIQRWNGVEAVDPFRIRDEVARNGAPITTSAGASRVAERLRAGRYIWGDVSTTRGRVRVHATLYETRRPGRAVREQTIQLASAETNLDSAFAGVAELLLFGRASTGPVDEQRFDTQSRPARIAFLRGRDEATTWNLAAADSLFRRATELDPAYARAYLWLAQVRSWGRDRPADLRTLSEKALANSGRLSPDDQRLATALGMIARGEYGNACAAYSAIVRADSTQFAAWYGLGECNAKDDIVLRDGDKLRFRSSYREALASYERAFTLLPTINRAFGARAYSRLQRLVKTSATDLRYGHAVAPDTMQFAAHPELINDTLAFTPFPLQEVEANSVRSLPASLPAALALQRRVFARIAAAWVAAMPDDASALEALAVALELAQDPSAIDTVHRARGLALTGEQRLRLAAREAIVRVKFAVPGNTSQLRVARALAESLLTASRAPSPAEAQILLPLAALTGDIVRAVALTSAVPPPPIVGKRVAAKALERCARAGDLLSVWWAERTTTRTGPVSGGPDSPLGARHSRRDSSTLADSVSALGLSGLRFRRYAAGQP